MKDLRPELMSPAHAPNPYGRFRTAVAGLLLVASAAVVAVHACAGGWVLWAAVAGLAVAGVLFASAPKPAPPPPAADDRDRTIARLQSELEHLSGDGARQRDERLKLLESAVVNAHDAVVILESESRGGPGRRVRYVNDAFARLTGYTREEVVGRSLHLLRGPDSDAATLERIGAALAACHPLRVELLNYRKDGDPFWVDLSLVPVRDAAGRCTHWVMIQRDVSDRKRAEEALRRSEERYRQLFDANPHPVWLFDRETLRFVEVNDAAVQKYGWTRDEFLRMTILDIRPPEDAERVIEAVRHRGTGYAPPESWKHVTRGGVELDVECSSFVLTLDGRPVQLALVSDVTERLRLGARLQKAQRMEVIGQLAGGIAHDFNNLLTAVLGNLALVTLPADDPNATHLAVVEQAAGRAAELTGKLLGYARKNQLVRDAVHPAAAFADVVGLLRSSVDPRVTIAVDVEPGCGPLLADPSLLNQALLNLCVNARDAMPGGGTLTLSAGPFTPTPADLAAHPDAVGGEFVRVTVADDGCGMTDEARARLFEPFFTTKEVGKGSGLGLPMVHGVMKQHHGWVSVESTPGAGTRVDLYFPPAAKPEPRPVRFYTPAAPSDTPPPRATPATGQSAAGAGRTILLVDDEPMIRDLGQYVLEQNGYRVLLAADGTDAVELFAEKSGEIDLVVLDVTMPRMSGRDAFRHMIGHDPSARILFSTGYSAEDVAGLDGAAGLLSKPYRPQELLVAVRAALADGPVPEAAGVG